MVDPEPFLESPFEIASNRWFEALLGVGAGLLVAVAAFGRSPVTVAAVAGYLVAVPVFVAVRVWLWESVVDLDPEEHGLDTDGDRNGTDENGDDHSGTDESGDHPDGTDGNGDDSESESE